MLKRLYDRVMGLAAHRRAAALLALVSFAESSVFPIPPDVLLVPMVLAARRRALRLALICTAASVAGGLAGYGIGFFLFDAVGRPLLELYGYMAEFSVFQSWYNERGLLIVFVAGLTPLPYKVFTIASGVTGLDLAAFTVGSILSRGLRFGVEAALLWRFGPPIRDFIERHLGKVMTAAVALLLGGFVLARWLA
ncbi:MAG: YqaA family protein [Alphaproteobacteria bacterium]